VAHYTSTIDARAHALLPPPVDDDIAGALRHAGGTVETTSRCGLCSRHIKNNVCIGRPAGLYDARVDNLPMLVDEDRHYRLSFRL